MRSAAAEGKAAAYERRLAGAAGVVEQLQGGIGSLFETAVSHRVWGASADAAVALAKCCCMATAAAAACSVLGSQVVQGKAACRITDSMTARVIAATKQQGMQ
jgi:hypothetical protein